MLVKLFSLKLDQNFILYSQNHVKLLVVVFSVVSIIPNIYFKHPIPTYSTFNPETMDIAKNPDTNSENH